MPRPKAVAFDSFQTLFSLDPLKDRLRTVGLAPSQLSPWYARAVRDACALAAADDYRPFADVAAAALVGLAEEAGARLVPAQVRRVMAGMRDLPAIDDVRPAFDRLRAAGVAVGLYSNGSADLMRHWLHRAGLADAVDAVVSVDDVRALKPSPRGYVHAAEVLGCPPAEAALVAAHSWDCHGAARAGLMTGWVCRQEMRFNPVLGEPTVAGQNLVEVVDRLLAAV